MNPGTFDWKKYHSYRVFDEFVERFIVRRQSYVTRHPESLDLASAFEDIGHRFVEDFDESEASYEDKIALQFEGASLETKIVFANLEYLWAMPVENLKPQTKRQYGERWFSDEGLLVEGDGYYFGYPHTIADPGPWYLRNKYWELVALLRVLSIVVSEVGLTDLASIKSRIAEVCHSAIYKDDSASLPTRPKKFCGVHCALMHLSNPDQYESIISATHRRQICNVFRHIVEDPSDDIEVLIKQIRSALYDSFDGAEDSDRKYRWFFYSKDVEPLWIEKKSTKEQHVSSAVFDVRNEESAVELEGNRAEVIGIRIQRSAKLVKAAKERDNYACRACNFNFKGQIVHVHHLDPISEYRCPRRTKLEDLVTLCPTCHYLAHYLLRQSLRYKDLGLLIDKIVSVREG